MVNENEKQVVEKYEREGWKTLRGGAPDFVFLKVNNNGGIEDFVFVEVKVNGDKLTYDQEVYRKVLETMGAKYKVEVVKSARPDQTNPIQSNPIQPTPCRATPSHPNSRPTAQLQTVPDHSKPHQPRPYPAKPDQSIPIQATPIPNQFQGGEKRWKLNSV